MSKIKVHQQSCQGAKQYQRDVSTGNYDLDMPSVAEVENNPEKYEITESSSCVRAILRESLEANRQKMFRASRTGLREDATQFAPAQATGNRYEQNQQLLGYQSQAAARGLVASIAGKNVLLTRLFPNKVKVTIFPDNSWECDCGTDYDPTGTDAAGKSPQDFCSHMDLFHPSAGDQESFRQRTIEAFKLLGMPEAEARIAAKVQGNDLFEAWTHVISNTH
jgi:hypothetical protein